MAAQLQLLTEFIKPYKVEPWYEMAVVGDFGPFSEWKTKADASNSAVMAERAKTRLPSMTRSRLLETCKEKPAVDL